MRNSFIFRLFLLLSAIAIIVSLAVALRNAFSLPAETAQSRSLFYQFVFSGGPIVWFVLGPMSLAMVYLCIEQNLTIRRARLVPEAIGAEITGMIDKIGIAGLSRWVSGRNDMVSIATGRALNESRSDWFRMKNALAESLQDQAAALLRKIEWLNLIGNVSPMVGLFGTVFGMIKLFNTIVTAGGQPQPAQLAEGISIALVTTFWGLFIAIPALAMNGILRNKIEMLANEAVVEAENIIPGIRKNIKTLSQAGTAQTKKARLPIQSIKPDTSQKAGDMAKRL
jgi:biopolymer transport protein ExbB